MVNASRGTTENLEALEIDYSQEPFCTDSKKWFGQQSISSLQDMIFKVRPKSLLQRILD